MVRRQGVQRVYCIGDIAVDDITAMLDEALGDGGGETYVYDGEGSDAVDFDAVEDAVRACAMRHTARRTIV